MRCRAASLAVAFHPLRLMVFVKECSGDHWVNPSRTVMLRQQQLMLETLATTTTTIAAPW